MAKRGESIAIIPARNEADFIGDVVKRTRAHVARVIVVDDGSTDPTSVEAAAAGAQVIVLERSSGKGDAIKAGLREALKDLAWNHVLFLDGDGQHIPEEIPRLLEASGNTDAGLVIGNRMGAPVGMPWLRHTVNRFVSKQICGLCRKAIPDTQCGFRLFRRDLVPLLLCETSGFDYETEVLILTARSGSKIETVPVTCRYGVERSKINPLRDTVRYFLLMNRYRRSKRAEWAQDSSVPIGSES